MGFHLVRKFMLLCYNGENELWFINGGIRLRAVYIGDVEKWKEGFEFSVPVKVRFSETDMYGHLNNTVTFTYFEYARIEFLKHIGFMSDWLDPKGTKIPVVADLQCDYHQQVFFDEELDIYVKAATVGNSSTDIHYWAVNGKGDTCFTGRGTLVQINKHSGKSEAWSEKEKTILLQMHGV